MVSLDVQLASCPYTSIQALPQGHEIRVLVRNILQLAYDSQRPRMPLQISQKIVQMLYRTTSQLGRDLYAALLEQLCRQYEDVEKEAINWLNFAEDDVRVVSVFAIHPCLIFFSAKIQCTCNSHTTAKPTHWYSSTRSTIGEVPLH